MDQSRSQADHQMLDDSDDFDPYGEASPIRNEAAQNEPVINEQQADQVVKAKPTSQPMKVVLALPGLDARPNEIELATQLQPEASAVNEVQTDDTRSDSGVLLTEPGQSISLEHHDTAEHTSSALKGSGDQIVNILPTTLRETSLQSPISSSNQTMPGLGNINTATANENNTLVTQDPTDSNKTPTDVTNAETALQANGQSTVQEHANVDGAEVEYDSSPYESSSDDTSSEDSNDSDDDYELLDPAEQARLLMAGDGSDDEGGKTTSGGQLRTANEKVEEVVEIPKIDGILEMKIEELGNIEAKVDNVILIKAKTSGEYQVLESGSVLCLPDRTVIGVVSETLGRVQEPLYCVRFTNAKTVTDFGLSTGSTICYVPQHSTFVFTQALQAVKGSDASNIHDEEIGGDEIEFSDDEAEAEYKRQKKLQKQERKGLRSGSTRGRDASSRFDGRPFEAPSPSTLSYDDGGSIDDGLYTPLSRPANLNLPGYTTPITNQSGGFSRGPGGMRGRGGRGRGGKNRGRGDMRNYPNARQPQFTGTSQSAFTAPGQDMQQSYTSTGTVYSPMQQQSSYTQTQQFQQPMSFQAQGGQPPNYYQSYPSNQYSTQPPQQYQQQAYPQSGQWGSFPQAGSSQSAPQTGTTQVPTGVPGFQPYFNPAAFFPNQFQQQHQQQQYQQPPG